MARQRVHLFIKGKVQGVFFRQAMKVTATKNHVTGWVKNLKDGRVEAVLEGEDLGVSTVVEWSHAGPANARVEDVEIINEKPKEEFTKFEVLY
ncbi:acylphosphatase [Candidatus Nitrosotenuis cloacae]|uniref:acylphosphatase n=1 Tax=Candidatus Nitrosotenuis cloacae TaxID=1603555 RepID=UPI00227FAC08|nr:acylphosphatase [Candidatus Nitrosotenuis cloacae]